MSSGKNDNSAYKADLEKLLQAELKHIANPTEMDKAIAMMRAVLLLADRERKLNLCQILLMAGVR